MLADVLLAVNVISAVVLVLLVLVQRTEGGLGALGGEGSGALMGGAGSENGLTKATSILAIMFLGSALWLAIETAGASRGVSVLDSIAEEKMDDTPAVPATLPSTEGMPSGK